MSLDPPGEDSDMRALGDRLAGQGYTTASTPKTPATVWFSSSFYPVLRPHLQSCLPLLARYPQTDLEVLVFVLMLRWKAYVVTRMDQAEETLL